MKKNGFTLIEMMIVVAIIAILASIAVPSYQAYIRQAAAKSAAGDLVSLSLFFEQKLQRKLAYEFVDASGSTLSSPTSATQATKALAPSWQPSRADFTFTAEWNRATYTLTADSTKFKCKLSLNSTNDRNATGADCGFKTW